MFSLHRLGLLATCILTILGANAHTGSTAKRQLQAYKLSARRPASGALLGGLLGARQDDCADDCGNGNCCPTGFRCQADGCCPVGEVCSGDPSGCPNVGGVPCGDNTCCSAGQTCGADNACVAGGGGGGVDDDDDDDGDDGTGSGITESAGTSQSDDITFISTVSTNGLSSANAGTTSRPTPTLTRSNSIPSASTSSQPTGAAQRVGVVGSAGVGFGMFAVAAVVLI